MDKLDTIYKIKEIKLIENEETQINIKIYPDITIIIFVPKLEFSIFWYIGDDKLIHINRNKYPKNLSGTLNIRSTCNFCNTSYHISSGKYIEFKKNENDEIICLCLKCINKSIKNLINLQ